MFFPVLVPGGIENEIPVKNIKRKDDNHHDIRPVLRREEIAIKSGEVHVVSFGKRAPPRMAAGYGFNAPRP